jgi:intracellular septation protein
MTLVFDIFPLLLFFLAYKFFGIYVATAVAITGSLIQVTYQRLRYKRFEIMQLITFFIILIFGGATLLMHEEIYIKWKPTILYWLLALICLATSLIGKKPLYQRIMEANIKLPATIWQRLNFAWAIFFLLLGSANLYVVYHYPTNIWVNFKIFGTLGLSLLFGIAQTFYITKFIKEQEK